MSNTQLKENISVEEDENAYNMVTEGNSSFRVLIINPNNIENFDWRDPNYLNYIMNMSIFENKEFKHQELAYNIGLTFGADKNSAVDLNTLIIGEDKNHLYEMLWNEPSKENKNEKQKNGIGKLLHLESKDIYGKVLLLKTNLPEDNYDNILVDCKKCDLYDLLFMRANHVSVLYDGDEWKEIKWCGDFDKWLDDVFDGDKYKQVELAFLKHNINIHYIPSTSDYGIELPNLINGKVDRCLFSTKITSQFWGNISLAEVNKILDISKLTDNTDVDTEMIKEEKDKFGRFLRKNKYRILNLVWDKLVKKNVKCSS